MTFPQSTDWGHLGTRNPAQFALMNPANFAGQEVYVDTGTTLVSYFSDGVSWVPGVGEKAVASLVAGAGNLKLLDATASSPVWTGTSVLCGELLIPANSIGPTGSIEVSFNFFNYSSNACVANLMLSGQAVQGLSVPTSTGTFRFTIRANNSLESQTTLRPSDGSVYNTTVSLGRDVRLQLYVQKGAAADVVWFENFSAEFSFGEASPQTLSNYQNAAALQVVTRSDILLPPPLPARVANDPRATIRTLAATPYTFPANFFNVHTNDFPTTTATVPPIQFSMIRTLYMGTNLYEMNTGQLTSAIAGAGGAGPFAGIDAAALARFDNAMSRAAAAGKEVLMNLMSIQAGAIPAWMATLGASIFPINIPAAGANRTALFASWAFWIRFVCERIRTRWPTLRVWLEPINEPNNPGTVSMSAADFVAVCNNFKTSIDAFGGGFIRAICSSYTDISGVTFFNSGSGGRTTLHEHIGNGANGTYDILTYHLYGGTVFRKNLNDSDPYRQVGMFGHYLRIIDPLFNANSQGRQFGIQGMLTDVGLTTPAVPGVSFQGGKELWITECGDAFVSTRDRNWYIRLALICSALGVTRYVFYYWGGDGSGGVTGNYGALPDMDIGLSPFAKQEYQAAFNFLNGKTINWVNANNDLTRVAASINGVVYEF